MKGGEHKLIQISIDLPDANAAISSTLLEISGWAIANRPIQKISFFINGEFLGNATHGFRRDDVGAVFPNIPGSDLSGYKAIADLYPLMDLQRENVLKIEVFAENEHSFVECPFRYALLDE